MPNPKEDKLVDLNDALEDIAEGLDNICAEISELRSDIQMVGTMILIDMLIKDKPRLKKKFAPLIEAWTKSLEVTLAEIDEDKSAAGQD